MESVADSSTEYQRVHLGPSRRADPDHIDRSWMHINDVTLEMTERERKMDVKSTEGRRGEFE
ncbi:hypothetical protein EYF80_039526 [Liparis tanakae]|uniref:Uncharacterized protein n=1 Tax=Liparis tanakae TaxID=230148 RepID=A0A4Z2GAK1_9TELE|nr:hypothetical protein EYF80_039526 [Liparis tanakae]